LFDIAFGRRSKKERKRDTLERNREKGRMGENIVAFRHTLAGEEVEKTHRGADLICRKRDPFTGRVVRTRRIEVKTGPHARPSKLQKKEIKKRRVKVERVDDSPLF